MAYTLSPYFISYRIRHFNEYSWLYLRNWCLSSLSVVGRNIVSACISHFVSHFVTLTSRQWQWRRQRRPRVPLFFVSHFKILHLSVCICALHQTIYTNCFLMIHFQQRLTVRLKPITFVLTVNAPRKGRKNETNETKGEKHFKRVIVNANLNSF